MLKKRRRRLYLIIVVIAGVGSAVGLVLYTLTQNINLYFTPSQIEKYHITYGHVFRLGGVVAKGSVHHVPNSLNVSFAVTDFHQQITVYYDGILPSLFRPGQGIVTQGKLIGKNKFLASQVLAKHDASYHPPEIKR